MKYPKELDRSLAGLVAKLPSSAKPIMVFASAIAAPVSIWIIFIIIIILALATNNDQLLKAALIGAALAPIAELIKLLTRRHRPETLYVQRMRFKTYSFPSGHSYTSVLVFGFLAVLATSALPYGFILSFVLASLAFIVGVSRVFLGAHFPSDVLAGWMLGFFMLTLWVRLGL